MGPVRVVTVVIVLSTKYRHQRGSHQCFPLCTAKNKGLVTIIFHSAFTDSYTHNAISLCYFLGVKYQTQTNHQVYHVWRNTQLGCHQYYP